MIEFNKKLKLDTTRIEGTLVKKLKKAMESGSASEVLAAIEVLHHHIKAKYEGCRVRAKLRVIGREGVNIARWVRSVESCRSKDVSIKYLTDKQGCLIKEQDEMRKTFHQHFTQLFMGNSGLDRGRCLRDFLGDGLQLRQVKQGAGRIS